MKQTRAPDDVDDEVGEIEEVVHAQRRFSLTDFVGDRVRPLLVIGVSMAVFQQLIGINYGATILGFAGLSISSSSVQLPRLVLLP